MILTAIRTAYVLTNRCCNGSFFSVRRHGARWRRTANVADSFVAGHDVDSFATCCGVCRPLDWYLPQLQSSVPRQVEQWMYPLDQGPISSAAVFAHFLALAAVPYASCRRDWPGLLEIAWLRQLVCAADSLELCCLGCSWRSPGISLCARFRRSRSILSVFPEILHYVGHGVG